MHEELLTRLPLFQNLTPASRTALEAHLERRALARGQVLFRAGDEVDGLYVLLQGKVKLTKPSRQAPPAASPPPSQRLPGPPPRESILSLIGPGEIFGELSVLDGGRRSSTATAMLECRLLHAPRAAVLRMVHENHDVAQAMIHQMAHRVRTSNEIISGLVLRDVPGRLANLLLTLADRFGVPGEQGMVVHHDLTQAELAQMVGASRETVNKVLTDFASRNWIELQGKVVTIKEPARLRARIG